MGQNSGLTRVYLCFTRVLPVFFSRFVIFMFCLLMRQINGNQCKSLEKTLPLGHVLEPGTWWFACACRGVTPIGFHVVAHAPDSTAEVPRTPYML